MPAPKIDMVGYETDKILVLEDSGKRNAKGSIQWRCLCKSCNKDDWLLVRGDIKRGGVCKSCSYKIRKYEEEERSCVVCWKPFMAKNNTRTKVCSKTCKDVFLADNMRERINSSVEAKLRANISASVSRKRNRDKSTLDVEALVNKVALNNWSCEKTGVPFEVSGANAPSIDRINPDLPYIDSNVQVVTWIYNRCKQSDSDEDVMTFIKACYNYNFKGE